MEGKFYTYERDQRDVITITLNRPEVHNAFNDEFINELTDCFTKIGGDERARLVVLTGTGRSFCAGADLNWMKAMVNYSDAENFQDSKRLAGLFHAINDCPVPVIGKVNGATLGGGTGLVACCDHVIACQSAKFGFTEVRLGLIPAVISPFVMAKIGPGHARAWFTSGERFDALKAQEMGLVHNVVTLDDLNDATDKTIERFLAAGPQAARAAKALVREVIKKHHDKNAVTDYTCRAIAGIRVSAEGQEGMASLLEKRKPNWIAE